MVEHVPFFKALRTAPLSVQIFLEAGATLITTFEEAATVILAFCIRHEREMFRDFFTVHVLGATAITTGTAVVVVVVVVVVEVVLVVVELVVVLAGTVVDVVVVEEAAVSMSVQLR